MDYLKDYNHPCQVMADALTVQEQLGRLEGIKWVYVGDGNNMVQSMLELAAVVPIELHLVSPEGYQSTVSDEDRAKFEAIGSKVCLSSDPHASIKVARRATIFQMQLLPEKRIRIVVPGNL